MAKVFKKLGDFKANQSAADEKGPIVQGGIQVVNNHLVLTLPLAVTEDMCRVYEEEVERNGKKEIVPKGNMVVSFEIPEGLEITVDDLTFRVKRGGVVAKRYLTLGFDPRNGFKRIVPTEAMQAAANDEE